MNRRNGGERNRVVADIRYVIVSDLHFGAENSVLTTLNERPRRRRRPASPSIRSDRPGAVRARRRAPRAHPRAGPAADPDPRRDVLLALSSTRLRHGLRLFANLAFSDGSPVSTRSSTTCRATTTITYGRSRGRASTRATCPASPARRSCGPLAHHEAPVFRRTARGQLGAADRPHAEPAGRLGGRGASVLPEPGPASASGRRSLIVSHGHFTESIYSLMSRLRDTLYPGQRQEPPTDIAALEEENFA